MATFQSHPSAWRGHPVDVRTIDPTEIRQDYASPANKARLAERIRDMDERLSYRDEWVGSVTRQEIDDILAHGWPEGAAKALAMASDLKTLTPQAKAIKRFKVWSDNGDDIDMQRVYRGDLDTAWQSTSRRMDVGLQVITIACRFTHGAYVNAENIFWTGATALALTDILEDAGYRVELLAVNACQNDSKSLGVCLTVLKAADAPLTADSVASTLCHPATYRVYGVQQTYVSRHFMGDGSGNPQAVTAVMPVLVEAGLASGADVCIDKVYSEDAAITCITEALKRLQGE